MRGVNTYSSSLTDEDIAAGKHRAHIGGAWDRIGNHQFEYMVQVGLQPQHRLLDVGCGAMRGGVRFAAYLDPGNYFGIDVNDRLIEAALKVEVPAAGLVDRVPAENLQVTARFDPTFGVTFDYALAVSVFTHLPLNYIRLCLANLAPVMAPGGRFFATFFSVPDDVPYQDSYRQVHVTTYPERDPFHYRPSELLWAASADEWEATLIGDWGHPRGQQMMEYRRR
jgi:SAM-dependent methyltransferase